MALNDTSTHLPDFQSLHQAHLHHLHPQGLSPNAMVCLECHAQTSRQSKVEHAAPEASPQCYLENAKSNAGEWHWETQWPVHRKELLYHLFQSTAALAILDVCQRARMQRNDMFQTFFSSGQTKDRSWLEPSLDCPCIVADDDDM